MDAIPRDTDLLEENGYKVDSKSQVAPFRVVNIGNSRPSKLLDFILAIANSLKIEAEKNPMPMQAGNVPATWADTSLLEELTGYRPRTKLSVGIKKFVNWYRKHYNI